jgi:hypothetical protein
MKSQQDGGRHEGRPSNKGEDFAYGYERGGLCAVRSLFLEGISPGCPPSVSALGLVSIFVLGCSLFLPPLSLSAEAPVPAIVTFSDGSVLSGDIVVIGARPLTLVPLGEDRQRMILLRDILAIDQEVETSSMERPWVFKESGKAEKVYLDGQYPLMNFKTCVTLVSGVSVTGHVVSVVLSLTSDGGKQKLFLQRQIKGAKEQQLADIVHVSNIRMSAAEAAGGGPISGRVDGFGRVESVTALDNQRGQILFARVSKNNAFDFGTVLPGSYDLCVLTDTHVLTGHSDAAPAEAAGAPLQECDLAAINKKFPLADEFFNDRWILRLRGNRSFAKALVYLRRDTYYEAERWSPGGFLWHLEVWSWHLADPDWKLDRHYILIRHKQKGGEQNRKLMAGKPLDAVSPGSTCLIQPGGGTPDEWTFIRDLN